MDQQISFVLRDTRTAQEYPILPGGLRIGRASNNDVVLGDDKVSRHHAMLWVQGGVLYIRDENSTNGTWVGNERITAPRALQAGDRVRIGDSIFEVAVQSVPPPVAMSPPAMVGGPAVPWLPLALIAGGIILVLVLALAVRGRATLIPPETPTVTPTAPPTPTDTPTPTPTPTSAPTPTPPSPSPPAIVPELIEPKTEGEYPNPVTFRWEGMLGVGQAYRVTLVHINSGHTQRSDLLTKEEWIVYLDGGLYGQWRWKVEVIYRGQVVASSEERTFWFNPFAGGGGGPSPTDTPTPEPQKP